MAHETTVVLVHGAMQQTSTFDALRAEPALAALRSVAVQLPSSSPDPEDAQGVTEDVAAIRAVIAEQDGPVVLVAHSYGGAPASAAAAAEAERVGEIVYLAAFALDAGSSMLGFMGGELPAGYERSADGNAAKLADPSPVFSGVDEATVATALEHQNWQGLRSFSESVDAVPDVSAIGTYVIATADQALPPEVQRTWAAGMARHVELDSGHSPHLSHPREVAAVIHDAVSRVSARG